MFKKRVVLYMLLLQVYMLCNGVYDVFRPGYVHVSEDFYNQCQSKQTSNILPLVKVNLYYGNMKSKLSHPGPILQQSEEHTLNKMINSLKIGFIAYQTLCVTIALSNDIEVNPGPNCQNNNAKRNYNSKFPCQLCNKGVRR